MESAVTKKEMFETIKYVVNMMERGKDLTLKIEENYVEIIETNNGTIDKFVYKKTKEGEYEEIFEFEERGED